MPYLTYDSCYCLPEDFLRKCYTGTSIIGHLCQIYFPNRKLYMVFQCNWLACMRYTHWGWDNMAAIFVDGISKFILVNGNYCALIQIWLQIVPKGAIDNKSLLVQTMAWREWVTSPYLNKLWTVHWGKYISLSLYVLNSIWHDSLV